MIKRLFLFVVFFLVACSGTEPSSSVEEGGTAGDAALPAPTDAAPVIKSDAVSDIQILVTTNDFAVGTPRVPIALFSGNNQVADAQHITVTAFDLSRDPPALGWSGLATNYSDYEVPYWTLRPELPHAGNWGFIADVTLADGRTVEAQFAIAALETSTSPAVGSPAPASLNRTLADEADITKLTTDPDPTAALYELTIAEALQTGRPTVVTFATPAFCQTQICAPVVSSVEQVYESFKEHVNFIHVEIYDDFQELTVAETVTEWQLASEPWTFVIDEGTVVARLGGPVSPQELTRVLTPLLP